MFLWIVSEVYGLMLFVFVFIGYVFGEDFDFYGIIMIECGFNWDSFFLG